MAVANKKTNKDYIYIALVIVFLIFLFSVVYLIKQRVFTYGNGRMEKLYAPVATPNTMQEQAVENESEVTSSDDLEMKLKDLDSLNVDGVTSDLYQNSVDANSF